MFWSNEYKYNIICTLCIVLRYLPWNLRMICSHLLLWLYYVVIFALLLYCNVPIDSKLLPTPQRLIWPPIARQPIAMIIFSIMLIYGLSIIFVRPSPSDWNNSLRSSFNWLYLSLMHYKLYLPVEIE